MCAVTEASGEIALIMICIGLGPFINLIKDECKNIELYFI